MGGVPRLGILIGTDPAVVGAVARLAEEFAGRVDRDLVERVVVQCRRELDAAPEPALPELVERLARQRLLDLERPAPAAS